MKQFQFAKYCTPAQLYLVLAFIGIVAGFLKNFRVLTLITHSVFVVLFAWILNFLCRKGFTAISWILVLLPFVLAACTYTLALDAADKKDQEIVEGLIEGNDEDEDGEYPEGVKDESKVDDPNDMGPPPGMDDLGPSMDGAKGFHEGDMAPMPGDPSFKGGMPF